MLKPMLMKYLGKEFPGVSGKESGFKGQDKEKGIQHLNVQRMTLTIKRKLPKRKEEKML